MSMAASRRDGSDSDDGGDTHSRRHRSRSRPAAEYIVREPGIEIHEPVYAIRKPDDARQGPTRSRSRRPERDSGAEYVYIRGKDSDDKRASGQSGYNDKFGEIHFEPMSNGRQSRPRRRAYAYDAGPAKERKSSRRQSVSEANQDEDDVLDDYYGGQDAATDDPLEDITYDHRPSFAGENRWSARPGRPSYTDRPPVPPPDPPFEREEMRYKLSRPEYTTYDRVQEIRTTAQRVDFLRVAPHGAHNKALWPRAVASTKMHTKDRPGAYDDGESSSLLLKLLLTRRGMRFKGREFVYTKNTWDDREFAAHLQREYRSLKTREIGWLQKITSYKRIAFVYFLQYHAYPATNYPFGRWRISNKRPITRRDDQAARNNFMYRLEEYLRSGMLFTNKQDALRPKRDWVRRLDCLIEPGAVIDIEIKETFDTIKIYIGLIIAILLSLVAGLAYGFATPNQDFATGFSLASWVITSFGFFLAAIAAGEWIGLDKPGADMLAAEELSTGARLDRDMVEL